MSKNYKLEDELRKAVQNALDYVNEDNVVEILTKELTSRIDDMYMYRQDAFGTDLRRRIQDELTKRYVEDNYEKILKHIDMDTINRAINLNVAKKFSKDL
jgi:hypothetical protein